MPRKLVWLAAAPVAVAALLFGGAWFYTHVVEGDAPDRLTLADATETPSPGGPVAAAGTWTVTSGSQAGYRVKEVLFGQRNTAVGRTDKVTGSLTIAGTKVTAASFTVDMASVTSDQSRRDNQFRGRIMDVATYPTSTFALTAPIELTKVPADGTTISATAKGRLTLHGQSKDVTVEVRAQKSGALVKVSGSIHVVFDEWGIPSPSFGPASVEDNGELEFLLVFAKKS